MNFQGHESFHKVVTNAGANTVFKMVTCFMGCYFTVTEAVIQSRTHAVVGIFFTQWWGCLHFHLFYGAGLSPFIGMVAPIFMIFSGIVKS